MRVMGSRSPIIREDGARVRRERLAEVEAEQALQPVPVLDVQRLVQAVLLRSG
jgi:hypothetical protein